MKQTNESIKRRYKMYKAGKNWLYAPLLFLSLGAGIYAGGQAAQAATTEGELPAVTTPVPVATEGDKLTLTTPTTQDAPEITSAATAPVPAATPATPNEQAREIIGGRSVDQEGVDDNDLVLDVSKVTPTITEALTGPTPRASEEGVKDGQQLIEAIRRGDRYIKLANNITLTPNDPEEIRDKTFTIDGQGHVLQFYIPEGWKHQNQGAWQLEGNTNVTFKDIGFGYAEAGNGWMPLSTISSNIFAFDNTSIRFEGKIQIMSGVSHTEWGLITVIYNQNSQGTWSIADGATVESYNQHPDKINSLWLTQNFRNPTIGENVKFATYDYNGEHSKQISKLPLTPVQGYKGWINVNGINYYQKDAIVLEGLQTDIEDPKTGIKGVYYFQPKNVPETKTPNKDQFQITKGKIELPKHGKMQFDFGPEGNLRSGIWDFQKKAEQLIGALEGPNYQPLRQELPQLLDQLKANAEKTARDIDKPDTDSWVSDWEQLQQSINATLDAVVNKKEVVPL